MNILSIMDDETPYEDFACLNRASKSIKKRMKSQLEGLSHDEIIENANQKKKKRKKIHHEG